jgi:hypothetical protein
VLDQAEVAEVQIAVALADSTSTRSRIEYVRVPPHEGRTEVAEHLAIECGQQAADHAARILEHARPALLERFAPSGGRRVVFGRKVGVKAGQRGREATEDLRGDPSLRERHPSHAFGWKCAHPDDVLHGGRLADGDADRNDVSARAGSSPSAIRPFASRSTGSTPR